MTRRYWFKRRRYGWGFTPITWQGWVVVALWVLYIAAQITWLVCAANTLQISDIILAYSAIFVATVALILIAIRQGPKPKWRWGKKPTDNEKEDF